MKKRKVSLTEQDARAGFLFTLPFIVGFVCLFLFPLLMSALLSVRRLEMVPGQGGVMRFVGLAHFKRMFTEDPLFVREYLVGSFKDLFINFPCILIFSFFIAVLLNQKFRGRALARVIFFLPVVISSGVIMLVQNNMVQQVTMSAATQAASELGTAQLTDTVLRMVRTVKISPGMLAFVETAVERIYTITVSSGIQILIYLAGLQTISPSLYEASAIEGATGWENFWKITFPMISPMILVNGVYTIVDSMSGLTNPLIFQIQRTASGGDYGYAAAMSWVYFVLIAAVLGIFAFVCNKIVYYEN